MQDILNIYYLVYEIPDEFIHFLVEGAINTKNIDFDFNNLFVSFAALSGLNETNMPQKLLQRWRRKGMGM